MPVCSRHFTSSDYTLPEYPAQKRHLKKGTVPSQNLPVLSTENVEKRKRAKELDEGRQKRREKRAVVEPLLAEVALCEAEDPCDQDDDEEEHSAAASSAALPPAGSLERPTPPVIVLDQGLL
ncbi:hypothetical protein HPB47_003808 [Ixodes persulcatus]|uniref:Uncharacterized protein n=1 Tax=Ixodes persulcatus TaxID=34615 RepID=A0AC60PHF3_IXOPE|nr:hypothetical protein HPB47_003808 [Ixodes persulcatus]